MSKSQILPSLGPVVEHLQRIEDQVHSFLKSELEGAEANGVISLSRAMITLRFVKDKVDATFEEFNKLYTEVKDTKLPEAFDRAGVPSVNLDEGYRVTVAHQVRASVKANMKSAAIDWLKENGLGDIVSETINASTLSAVARSMGEENKQLSEEIFNVFVQPITSVNKTK